MRLLADDSKQKLPGPVTDYLLRAAMVGAVMSKDFAEVARIDDTFGRGVTPSESTFVQRVFLKAFADGASSKPLAGAGSESPSR